MRPTASAYTFGWPQGPKGSFRHEPHPPRCPCEEPYLCGIGGCVTPCAQTRSKRSALAHLDDGGPPLLDSGDEVALQPLLVLDSLLDGGPPDAAMRHIRKLRGGVVPPDDHILHLCHMSAHLLSHLHHARKLSCFPGGPCCRLLHTRTFCMHSRVLRLVRGRGKRAWLAQRLHHPLSGVPQALAPSQPHIQLAYLGRRRTWPKALLWSRRVRQVMSSAGMDGAFSFRMSAFVLAGLATTSTCANPRQHITDAAVQCLGCSHFRIHPVDGTGRAHAWEEVAELAAALMRAWALTCEQDAVSCCGAAEACGACGQAPHSTDTERSGCACSSQSVWRPGPGLKPSLQQVRKERDERSPSPRGRRSSPGRRPGSCRWRRSWP